MSDPERNLIVAENPAMITNMRVRVGPSSAASHGGISKEDALVVVLATYAAARCEVHAMSIDALWLVNSRYPAFAAYHFNANQLMLSYPLNELQRL